LALTKNFLNLTSLMYRRLFGQEATDLELIPNSPKLISLRLKAPSYQFNSEHLIQMQFPYVKELELDFEDESFFDVFA